MIVLPPTFSSVEHPQSANQLIWMLEVWLERGDEDLAPVLIRVTDNEVPVEWPLGLDPPQMWEPFPFDFTAIEQTTAGDMPSIDVTIDNSAKMLARWLHASEGLEGNPAKLWCVPKNALEIPSPDHEYQLYEYEVETVAATNEAVTIRLALPDYYSKPSPSERYIPQLCPLRFGSTECGYPINSFAAYVTCPKKYGPCGERGIDLQQRGLPPVLPGNFKGRPGISRRRQA